MFSEGKTITKISWSPAEDTAGTGTCMVALRGLLPGQDWHRPSSLVWAPRGSVTVEMHLEAFVAYLSLQQLK